ncbi:MAG: type 4a pilus biogenesis protein PilO, partial [Deltaproteobacteria bacterium]
MADIKDIISKLEIPAVREYREAVIGLMLIAAATFFFYQYIYLKKVVELKKIDSQIQEVAADVNRVSTEIKETQKIAERLKDAMERLKDMEERFTVTQSKLPSDKQLSSILKGLIGDDRKRGIKFISLRPLPLEPKGEYFKLPFQITMQARF